MAIGATTLRRSSVSIAAGSADVNPPSNPAPALLTEILDERLCLQAFGDRAELRRVCRSAVMFSTAMPYAEAKDSAASVSRRSVARATRTRSCHSG